MPAIDTQRNEYRSIWFPASNLIQLSCKTQNYFNNGLVYDIKWAMYNRFNVAGSYSTSWANDLKILISNSCLTTRQDKLTFRQSKYKYIFTWKIMDTQRMDLVITIRRTMAIRQTYLTVES